MLSHRAAEEADSRTLVVTGDDFGLTPGINRGIVEAHRHGVLTHASLMATAPFVADAIDLARSTPSLSLGVHLLLVDGRPCLRAARVSSLLGADHRFRPTAGALVRDWVLSRINPSEVEHELRAQVERVLAAGIRPTHLDSHKHVHMWPPVFELVVRLAVEYDVPAVRLALEHPVRGLWGDTRGDARARRQAIDNVLMAPLAWADARALAAARMPRAASFAGRVYTGLLSFERLARTIRGLPPGRSELMTHPGYMDEHLAAVRTRLRAEREQDLALLCAPETRRLLREEGIVLATPAPEWNRREPWTTPFGPAGAAGTRAARAEFARQIGGHLCCES